MVPVPGRRRTRATASLRRPVVWVSGDDTSFSLTAANRRVVVLRRCLGRVRVLGTGVDEELAHDFATESVLRDHALDGVEDQLDRVLVEQGLPRGRAQTARVTRVVVGELLGRFVGGEHDLVGVHDDDVVTAVNVRGEIDTVLAAQERGGDGRESTEHEAFGVDDAPLPGDLTGFWRKCAHRTFHKRLLTAQTGSEGLLSLGKIRLDGKSSPPFSLIRPTSRAYLSFDFTDCPRDPILNVAGERAPSWSWPRARSFRATQVVGPRHSRER